VVAGLTRPDGSDSSDQDPAAQDAHMRPGGSDQLAEARLQRHKAAGSPEQGKVGAGCPNHRGESIRTAELTANAPVTPWHAHGRRRCRAVR
jgi:hypothetical protein